MSELLELELGLGLGPGADADADLMVFDVDRALEGLDTTGHAAVDPCKLPIFARAVYENRQMCRSLAARPTFGLSMRAFLEAAGGVCCHNFWGPPCRYRDSWAVCEREHLVAAVYGLEEGAVYKAWCRHFEAWRCTRPVRVGPPTKLCRKLYDYYLLCVTRP